MFAVHLRLTSIITYLTEKGSVGTDALEKSGASRFDTVELKKMAKNFTLCEDES